MWNPFFQKAYRCVEKPSSVLWLKFNKCNYESLKLTLMATRQAGFETKHKLSHHKTRITFFLSFLTLTNWERKQLGSAICTVWVFWNIKGHRWLSYLVQFLLYCWDLCEQLCPLGFNVGQSCSQCSCIYLLKPEELVPSAQDRRFLWWFSIHFFWKLL